MQKPNTDRPSGGGGPQRLLELTEHLNKQGPVSRLMRGSVAFRMVSWSVRKRRSVHHDKWRRKQPKRER
jgi:hypothetical protein